MLQQYLSDIVTKDVIARNEIRNRKALDQLVGWYFNNANCLHDAGMRNVAIRSDRMDRGRLAENTVFLELCRKKCEISYFKENGEVDFVLTHLGKPIQAIQVCDSNLENEATEKRELGSLLECLKTTRLKEGLILTRDLRKTLKTEGCTITCLPVHEWLLAGDRG